MKRIYIILLASLAIFCSCEEFQLTFTGNYQQPAQKPIYTDADFSNIITIRQLAERYNYGSQSAVLINDDVVIKGVVSTDDKPGNFYKSMYIQDETGGMEIKVGRNGLYNEYKPGQTVYVKCGNLYVGMYGYDEEDGAGMIQVGHIDPTGEYETSYLESALVVDNHIFKGKQGNHVTPVVLTDDMLPGKDATAADNQYVGTLVTLNNLKYDDEVFALLYLNSNKNKKEASNRIFLSNETWGITTWAMSKNKMREYLESGLWDKANIGSGQTIVAPVSSKKVMVDSDGDGYTDKATYPDIEKAAYSVSQYFKTPGGKSVQIRTSGYSKFGDTEIDPDVLSGKCTINATGILTLYQGKLQLVLIDLGGIEVNPAADIIN